MKLSVITIFFILFSLPAYAQESEPGSEPEGVRMTPPVSTPPAPPNAAKPEVEKKTETPSVKKVPDKKPEAALPVTPPVKKTEPLPSVKSEFVDKKVPFEDTVKVTPAVKKESTLSKLKFKVNGFIWLDTWYTNTEVYHIESPFFVRTESRGDALAFSARYSRLRFTLDGPSLFCGVENRGVFEMDFFGNLPDSSTSPRQPQMRMRLAFIELKFHELVIHAGNDWMVAAPQFSSNLDPFNLWGQGNIWMRYPQINVNYKNEFTKNIRLEAAASVGNSLGGDGPKNTTIRHGGIGEFSALPTVQARAGIGFKLGKSAWSTVGISGSWQMLNLAAAVDASNKNIYSDAEITALKASDSDMITSWFGAADIQLNYTWNRWKFKITGEYHQGQAMAMYLGGILQNYDIERDTDGNIVKAHPIKSIGYFGDFKVESPCGFSWTIGGGRNTVDEDDLFTSDRKKNTIMYSNITWTRKFLMLGLGVNYLKTEYTFGKGDADAVIVHFVTAFKF